MRPLFLDHELVMTSNQLTFQVQKRTIPKNSDTGKSGTGKAPLSPDSLTAADFRGAGTPQESEHIALLRTSRGHKSWAPSRLSSEIILR